MKKGIIVVAILIAIGVYSVSVNNTPNISVEAVASADSGWDVAVTFDNFKIGEHDSDGHVHVYIDDVLVDLIFEPNFHIDPLPRGEHEIRVALNGNDHAEITSGGIPISDSITVVSETDGSIPEAFDTGAMNMGGYGDTSEEEKMFMYMPTRVLISEQKWKPKDLMVIIEKERGGVAFIDGSTNELVGRIEQLGERPHTMVFSPTGTHGFLISRDGWLSKIDLTTLEVEESIKVGESSRGTAITKSGKYVAIGNYEPPSLVILDAETLSIERTVNLSDTRIEDGVTSRAGAVLESGELFAVALKDINSVWIIDTQKKDLPVTEYFWDVGDDGGVMHDGYSTPDGKHLVFSIEESNVVWVLNTERMEEVAEIATGITPHTGPGATWGKYTFIPAIKEGRTTVINKETWKLEKYIETKYPSQFPRAYTKDSSYPYVWIDSWLPGQSDELYIIDARTLSIIETLIPVPGKMAIHPEFTLDGKYVYVSIMEDDLVHIYDSNTFKLVDTIEVTTPTGIFNVGLRTTEAGL